MNLSASLFVFAALFSASFAAPTTSGAIDAIDQKTFDDLVLYTKYSSAAYQLVCPKPVGNKLVKQFSIVGTDGFVARDDNRKEIVVAFRGSLDPFDAFIDIHIIMKPLVSPGVTGVGDSYVHRGFLFAYNVAADKVLRIVKDQLSAYPSYSVVVTGHSLGGAVASLAAISIRAAHPSIPLKLFTFGQPRTGNAAFASFVERQIGHKNIYRAVHTKDGVPTILPRSIGYRHFATEYWNFKDPATPANVRRCVGGDDPTCSDSILSHRINLEHVSYFGQAMALNPLLCL